MSSPMNRDGVEGRGGKGKGGVEESEGRWRKVKGGGGERNIGHLFEHAPPARVSIRQMINANNWASASTSSLRR